MSSLSELLKDADPLRHEPPVPAAQREFRRQAIVAAASHPGKPSLTRLRSRTPLLAGVFIVAALLIGPRVWSLFVVDVHAAVPFEVRLAEENPGPGLRPASVRRSGRVVYLHENVVVTNGDVAKAYMTEGSAAEEFSVGVDFTAEGARKMLAATEGHVGRPIAILIEDEVVVALTVRSPVSSSAMITGRFSKARAERIVNGIGMP